MFTLKATIPHIVAWLYFEMNFHQNMKLHHSLIYLYQLSFMYPMIKFTALIY